MNHSELQEHQEMTAVKMTEYIRENRKKLVAEKEQKEAAEREEKQARG